ncbi:MAG: AAA family ATPase [Candidatus Omnitrophica bacterium]|nr:AAA family ATPase [Candidatus Omnitrophota bacterium]
MAMSEKDKELFELLKKQRMKIAKENNWAPFHVFKNSSLEVMIKEKPTDMISFKKIKGVGPVRAEKCGDDFINIIIKFCEDNNITIVKNEKILEDVKPSNDIDIENVELSKEFQEVLNLMENSKENLFITGNAGTGKTSLLKFFKQKTKKKIAILAPTGLAAINIGGQTINSFFRFPFNLVTREQIVETWKNKPAAFKAIFRSIETIVIDEASMVRADIIDGINETLRFVRGSRFGAFGGVKMIFIGDLCQLPPVVDDTELKEYFTVEMGGEYFFNAKVLKRMQHNANKYVELIKVYRQKDKDFIAILNKIRGNTISLKDIELLNTRVKPQREIEAISAIKLTTTNFFADRYNKESIEKIFGSAMQYEAQITGEVKENFYPTEKILNLKVGAQIILIKNDPDKRWVNGSLGIIKMLSENKIQVTLQDGRIVDVPKITWENIKYKYDKKEKKINEHVVGTFTQYPIKLAWAITIHKSQGQTFDNVVIDFGEGAFAHGQAYVALSRCRSLEGITLSRPLSKKDVIFDSRVDDFIQVFEKIELECNIKKCNNCHSPLELHFKYCPHCGCEKEVFKEDALKNHKKICSECGECYDFDDGYDFDEGDENLCDDCMTAGFTRCDSCDELVDDIEIVEMKNEWLCEKCSEGLKQCACCGDVFWEDELILNDSSGEYYCEDDYNRLKQNGTL